jgi:hypothetical protein
MNVRHDDFDSSRDGRSQFPWETIFSGVQQWPAVLFTIEAAVQGIAWKATLGPDFRVTKHAVEIHGRAESGCLKLTLPTIRPGTAISVIFAPSVCSKQVGSSALGMRRIRAAWY